MHYMYIYCRITLYIANFKKNSINILDVFILNKKITTDVTMFPFLLIFLDVIKFFSGTIVDLPENDVTCGF